jgi:hypothetical protein
LHREYHEKQLPQRQEELTQKEKDYEKQKQKVLSNRKVKEISEKVKTLRKQDLIKNLQDEYRGLIPTNQAIAKEFLQNPNRSVEEFSKHHNVVFVHSIAMRPSDSHGNNATHKERYYNRDHLMMHHHLDKIMKNGELQLACSSFRE